MMFITPLRVNNLPEVPRWFGIPGEKERTQVSITYVNFIYKLQKLFTVNESDKYV